VQCVESSVDHVQFTVKRNVVFGCRLYWRDDDGDVPCVCCIMLLVQRGVCVVPCVYCIMLLVQRGVCVVPCVY
jgi:hypothetical protein